MNDFDAPIKSAEGADEVRSRGHRLSPRLRTLLIMVDGKTTAAQLRHAAAAFGAPVDALDQLLARGLVAVTVTAPRAPEPTPVPLPAAVPRKPPVTQDPRGSANGERLREAQKVMNAAAVDAMGLRAFFFTMKLDECFGVDDLRPLIPELLRAVQKKRGEAAAGMVEETLRQMLR